MERKQRLLTANAGDGEVPASFIRLLTPAAWYRYGVGITVTGQGVSTWADQSGNGRDLLQGTDGARPPLQADNSILFNGTDEFLKAATFTFAQPETVYLLLNPVSWTANDSLFDGEATNSGRIFQNNATPQINGTSDAATFFGNTTGLTVGAYSVLAVVLSGAASVFQINSTSTTGSLGTGSMSGFTLAAAGGGGSTWSNIRVKEAVLFAAAHDVPTRARVINYLKSVGGL